MYVDEVDFEDILSPDKPSNLVFTDFVHRQMQQLVELESFEKMETDKEL